ncbi:hypothetical protein SAMN05216198_2059 [Halopseudomonas litoralis]|uniref:Uncharacterized protein n=1 Tax=Halopseudomonas litoralis TaxID=797277 RepID=A0A1H1SKY8_9GAMM|nr:hypothetical protein [Halopseudomonas litoralis]SDS48602.1 hypothetical protein SAMN05216198_2059 [Halopseudomonas litoralis]
MNNPLIEHADELRFLLDKLEAALPVLKQELEPDPATDPELQSIAVRFAIGDMMVPLNLMRECLTGEQST